SKLKTQNSKLKTQNSKLKTQNSKLKTQNSKLKTQNSKLKTHRVYLSILTFVQCRRVSSDTQITLAVTLIKLCHALLQRST
ncbi:hypothetical protein, partial [Rheinheimera sp. UJ63]|uniref:hypothetical protein n=1 Tax=Rheinheimera sp. UJ63 TaxID=2910157 RepID=UPI001F2DDA0E